MTHEILAVSAGLILVGMGMIGDYKGLEGSSWIVAVGLLIILFNL